MLWKHKQVHFLCCQGLLEAATLVHNHVLMCDETTVRVQNGQREVRLGSTLDGWMSYGGDGSRVDFHQFRVFHAVLVDQRRRRTLSRALVDVDTRRLVDVGDPNVRKCHRVAAPSTTSAPLPQVQLGSSVRIDVSIPICKTSTTSPIGNVGGDLKSWWVSRHCFAIDKHQRTCDVFVDGE